MLCAAVIDDEIAWIDCQRAGALQAQLQVISRRPAAQVLLEQALQLARRGNAR